jgi:RNA polymerase sigma-70 factor (ECF subfamily)
MSVTDLRDPIQFNEAYRRTAATARASANRVLRDEAAAEDVVQDVFMQLWLKPSLYDPSRGSLNSFVSMLARSRALDRWRSRTARDSAVERQAEQSRVLARPAESAAEPVIRRERSLTILHALDELPADQRDALLLAYGRGLTAQEIARVADVPLGTAKSRVRLGLRKARVALDAAAA